MWAPGEAFPWFSNGIPWSGLKQGKSLEGTGVV